MYRGFVTKLDPQGTSLLYTILINGIEPNNGVRIAVDGSGNAYIDGTTMSVHLPTVHALQPFFGGGTCTGGRITYPCSDVFVAKITSETDS